MAGSITPRSRASIPSYGALALLVLVLVLCVAPPAAAATLDLPLRVRASVGGIVIDSDALVDAVTSAVAERVPLLQAEAPADPAAAEAGPATSAQPSASDDAATAADSGAQAWRFKIGTAVVAGALAAMAGAAARRRRVRPFAIAACMAVGLADLGLTTAAYLAGGPSGLPWLAATAIIWILLVVAARRLASPRARSMSRLARSLDDAHLEASALRLERLAARNRALHAEVEATRRARLALGDEP